MNPLIVDLIAGAVRWALQGIFVWMLEKGIMHKDQQEAVTLLVVGAVGSILTLAWSSARKWISRRKLLIAAASPAGTTENAIEEKLKQGMAPPATTPKDEKPKLQSPDPPKAA